MAEATSAIPVGVYPYLTVKGGKAAVEFYTRAFGANEAFRSTVCVTWAEGNAAS